MKNHSNRKYIIPFVLLISFVLWTAAVCRIDVHPIGPQSSTVGFASLNQLVHDLTGVHMQLYTITDWLGLVPLLFAAGFAVLGLVQWIKGHSIRKVDRSILILGGFYAAVMAAYWFFEIFVINYRPVMIEGILESSYPSSTTMLVMFVMPTAAMQLRSRSRSSVLRWTVSAAITAFTVLMVMGRLISGVHWVTDIIGGALLSMGLAALYHTLCNFE